MKRVFAIKPAYDCIKVQPCVHGSERCKPGTGGCGISAEKWVYSVVSDDGRFALALTVKSGRYLFSEQKKAEGASLQTHIAYAETREQVNEAMFNCDLLPGGKCRGGTVCLAADDFFKQHGADQKEQSDEFWSAMEVLLTEWVEPETEYERCKHCDGTGTVKKP